MEIFLNIIRHLWRERVMCVDSYIQRQSAAAYMAGSLKTVAHATLSPYGLYLYLYMYGCGCTYRVTLRVFS